MAHRWDRDRFERYRADRGGRDDLYYEEDLGHRRNYNETSTKGHDGRKPSPSSVSYRERLPIPPAPVDMYDPRDVPEMGREWEQSSPRRFPLRRQSSLDTFDRGPSRRLNDGSEDARPILQNDRHHGGPKPAERAQERVRYSREDSIKIPGRLVSRQALADLGYSYIEKGTDIIILTALSQELVDEVLNLSDRYNKVERKAIPARSSKSNLMERSREKLATAPHGPPTLSPTMLPFAHPPPDQEIDKVEMLESNSDGELDLTLPTRLLEQQSNKPQEETADTIDQPGLLGTVSKSENLGGNYENVSHARALSVSGSAYGSHANTSQALQTHTMSTDRIDEGSSQESAMIHSADSAYFKSNKMYIEEFARTLSGDVLPASNSTDYRGLLLPLALPSLLESFARRLRAESTSNARRALSVLFFNKSKIIASFLHAPAIVESSKSTDGSFQYATEKDVSSSFNSRDEYITERTGSIDLAGLDINSEALANVDGFQTFLKASAAYRWLISAIKQSWQLAIPGPRDSMEEISQSISRLAQLQAESFELNSRAYPAIIKMKISLDWDLMAFIRQQEYDVRPEDVLSRVICLTGDWDTCHLTTPLDYLKQTWPLTYMPLYGLMVKYLTLGAENCDYETNTGVWLRCEQQATQLLVSIWGPLDFIVDTIEQLAWLASTLRCSPVPEGVMKCTPFVARVRHSATPFEGRGKVRGGLSDGKGKGKVTQSLRYDLEASCELKFDFEKPPVNQPRNGKSPVQASPPGLCWFNMFRNPVLVDGFPIPRRARTRTGLEIPLAYMSLLLDSDSIFRCGESSMIIKGFCCLLIAVEAAKDVVIWHLLFNPSGDRISFFDTRLDSIRDVLPQDLALKGLDAKRHVVGWCGDVTEYTGHPNANWAISPSYLPEAPSSFVLEKAYIEGGAQLLGGLIGSLGVRDKPAHLRREGSYFSLLDFISTQAIVFCDAEDRRVWLVDGASALLHLTRASIEQDRHKPVYRLNWRFDGLLEGDEIPGGGAAAAIKILCNPRNLNRPLYIDLKPSETGHMDEVQYTFYHRVKEVMCNLELLIDHQTQVSSQDGYWFRQSGKIINKSIMGFDFWDIAKPQGLVRPRAYYLPWTTIGHGWIEYIRSIKATTLFGTGFGDLLKSTNPSDLCSSWRTIPTGQDYLATSISSLKAIHASQTNSALSPGDAASKIVWSSRSEPFSRCWCAPSKALVPASTTANSRSHLDPVQMLLPKGAKFHLYVSETPRSITLGDLGDTGAVVFGHTMLLRDRLKLSSSSHDNTSQGGSSTTDSKDDSSHTGSLSATGTTATSSSTSNSVGPDSSTIQDSNPGASRASPAPPSPVARSSSTLAVGGDPGAARLGKKAFWKRLSIRELRK